MITRLWRGWTNPRNSKSYEDLLKSEVLPGIHKFNGYHGAYLLRKSNQDESEFMTLTFWDSIRSIQEFAGQDYETAVVPPAARKLLSRFDERSIHYATRHQHPTKVVGARIARLWHGWGSSQQANGYEAFIQSKLLPEIQALPGYEGLYLLRKDSDSEAEFVVITLWESLDAIRSFAGDDSEKAVIDPDGAQHLSRFDSRSKHYDILLTP